MSADTDQHPGRIDVRGVEPGRRHGRPAGPAARLLLQGHPTPVPLGPHRQRRRAGGPVHRHRRVLLRPVLPRTADRDDLPRPVPVPDPPPADRRRVRRGAHPDEPRRRPGRAGRPRRGGADFADLFEVKDALAKKGTLYREVRAGDLVLGYRRDDFVRETQVGSSEPAEVDGQALVFRVRVAAKSEWTTRLEVRPVTGGEVHVPKHRSGPPEARPNLHGGLQQWVESAPQVSAQPHQLRRVYARSLVDLAACASTRTSCPARRSRPPASPGSWPCSAATA